jgi:signal transduction histidine kinase
MKRLRSLRALTAAFLVAFITATGLTGLAVYRATHGTIVDGDTQRRVPVDGSDSAFDQQARAFNAMLDRIAALMAEISNVSNDIAHDLRTPLARLRGRLQALAQRTEGGADGGAPTPAIAAEIEAAIAESDTLLAMFAAILRIAEIEGGARRAGFERVDLGAIAHHVATTMQPAAADAGRSLADGDPVHLPVAGDRRLLAQALINLVENAIRHTPEGSRIRIAAIRAGDRALVMVEDDGHGIPAAERARALRRFGRLDGSRASSGHGLGLPLVESIARLHRGTLSLDDAGPGLRAVIALPIAS